MQLVAECDDYSVQGVILAVASHLYVHHTDHAMMGESPTGTPIGRTGAGASMLIALCTVLALRGWDLSLTSFRSVEVGALAVVDFGRFHHRFGERWVRMDR